MGKLHDLAYIAGLTLASPVLLPKLIARGRHKSDWASRFGRTTGIGPKQGPRILLHAVSVGEVNAIRLLVESLLHSELKPEIVLATTTDTGAARAEALFGDTCTLVRYPLDASWSVRRFLDSVQPDIAVMVELELWPNFTESCVQRSIPILVVNGRLSERSFRGYQRGSIFTRPLFQRIDCAAVQTQEYAKRFEALGTSRGAIVVTGTMKWDTAKIEDEVDGAEDLAQEMGIDRSRPLVVAGSTAPAEHLLLRQSVPEGVQLLCAPRRPEWFDSAADVLAGCTRRSCSTRGTSADYFLLDTIGELRKAYALADVVVVGRSFGTLHGSDMMEPAALGKPVIVGPATSDFKETVTRLEEGDGIVVSSPLALEENLRVLLQSESRRAHIAENARKVILAEQGATERTCELLLATLERTVGRTEERVHA